MSDASPRWPPGTSVMAGRVRDCDWERTPLGPSADWAPELRASVTMVLDAGFPSALIWGDQLTTIYNDGFMPILGDKPDALGRSFAEIWAEAWDEIGPIARRALGGEATAIDDFPLTIDRTGRLEQAWFTFAYSPLRSAEGDVLGFLDTVIETTGRMRAEQSLRLSENHLRVLVGELQHRVRNILTIVRSVFSRTVDTSTDPLEMIDHFRGRLDAMARTQVVLTRNAERSVDLENLIRDELLSVGISDARGVSVAGPDVSLDNKAAEVLGLAIHELTTNAIKYGALKVNGATLDISWALDVDQREVPLLRIAWMEQGVPAVTASPSHYGFGRELIEEALPYRLGAETKLEFRGGGVCCSISLPLAADGASSLEPKGDAA
jgi:two-component sensor histidine kinase